jgi:hypothetical protein
MKILAIAASTYEDKWMRMAGDKAVDRLSRIAVNRGYLHKVYDLQTLSHELQGLKRQGRLNAQEWSQVKNLLAQAWHMRKKSG